MWILIFALLFVVFLHWLDKLTNHFTNSTRPSCLTSEAAHNQTIIVKEDGRPHADLTRENKKVKGI